MKSLAWKLAAVAAVIGIVFLVMLQAQRGMSQAALNRPPGDHAGPGEVAGDGTGSTGDKTPDDHSNAAKPREEKQAGSASKPDPFDELAGSAALPTAKTPAGPTPVDPASLGDKTTDRAADLVKKSAAASATKAPDDTSSASTKPSAPGSASEKPGGSAAPPSGVKQTAALDGQESGAKDFSDLAAPPARGAAHPSGPSPGSAAGSPPAAKTSQTEPAEQLPELPIPAGGANAPGPQLLPPGDGQPSAKGLEKPNPPRDGEKPSERSPLPLELDGGKDIGPPNGLPKDAKTSPSDNSKSSNAPSAQPGPAPSLFPESDAAPIPARNGKNHAPALGSETDAARGEHSPSDSKLDSAPPPTELGSSKDSKTKPVDAANKAKDADRSAPPSLFPGSETKESPATGTEHGRVPQTGEGASGSAAAGRGTEIRQEPGSDFRGDGTVGESAPLGPQRPQISIEKIAPPNALLMQPLIYSILVKNIGSIEARDIVVDDRIPKGTKLTGTIPRAERAGTKLTWRLGNLGPGEQRKISIRVIPMEPGEIGSVATVNFVAEAAAETVVTAPRLEFHLSAQPAARLGELVPFRFQIKNIGTGEAHGVVIRDVIPDGFSHAAGKDLEYEIGRLAAGQSKELTLDLKAVKVGPTSNRALVTAEGGLSVDSKVAVEITGSKVSLSRSGPPRRYLGRPAVYSNTIVNESKYDIEGVAVVESVPPGMEFAAATHGGQYNEGTRTIAWRLERLAPFETRVLKSRLVPKAPGTQVSTVRVSIPNGEPMETTGQTMVEGFAALSLEMGPVESPVDVGEKLTLQINARNKGTIAASNVELTVEVPEQMAVVSARGPGKFVQEGNRVRFGPMPTLEGRTAAACEIVVEAKKRGDSRIRVSVRADQLDKPLSREESVLVLSEAADPAAPGNSRK